MSCTATRSISSRTLGPTAPFAAIVFKPAAAELPAREARASLLAQIFARLAPSAPFIQFSYGVKPPVPAPDGVTVKRAAFVAFNLPPARVWVYRKTQGA